MSPTVKTVLLLSLAFLGGAIAERKVGITAKIPGLGNLLG